LGRGAHKPLPLYQAAAEPKLAQRHESWHYDFAGNLDQYTNPTGQVKHLHYDPRNRMDHSYWTSTVGGVLGPAITTVYDNASRIKRVSTNNFQTIVDFDYDEANRQKWEEQALALPNETPITHRVNTPPDKDGLRKSLELTDPPSLGGNLTVSPELTGSGSLSVTYTYTKRNQLESINPGVSGENWQFTYKYDSSGNMSSRQADFNGHTNWTKCPGAESDAYDPLNRPTKWEQSGLTGLYTLSHHQYDHANREISTWRVEDNKGERYAYEPTNQLAGVGYNAANVSTWPPSGAERLVTYGYASGKLNRNFVTEALFGQTQPTQSYTNDPLNQYLTVGGNSYSYDTNFNLTHAGMFFGVYNAANQLISASDGGSFIAEFFYDGLGRCVKRTLGKEAAVFVYDGWKPIGEFDEGNNLKAWNLYGPGADEILMRNKGNMGYTIFLLDRHGNVAFLVDNDGRLREKYTYDVFGRPTIINTRTLETISTPWYSHDFLFQGREYISQLGIYDYRNRFYLPATGRFLQTDSKGFDAGDMNLFRYCGDDPVDRSDPLGLDYGPFDTADQAYRFFDANFNNRSIQENKEYRVEIYQGTGTGKFYTTNAQVGSENQAGPVPIGVKHSRYIGPAHTHGDWSTGYTDRNGKQHVTGRAKERRLDDFKSGEPLKTDRNIAKKHTVYTSTPARDGWRQGPNDKNPERVPTRDRSDPKVDVSKPLDASQIEQRENPSSKNEGADLGGVGIRPGGPN
jgi:RHS repeat-associated protein